MYYTYTCRYYIHNAESCRSRRTWRWTRMCKGERERVSKRKIARDRERQTDRQRQRQSQWQRDKETEMERERLSWRVSYFGSSIIYERVCEFFCSFSAAARFSRDARKTTYDNKTMRECNWEEEKEDMTVIRGYWRRRRMNELLRGAKQTDMRRRNKIMRMVKENCYKEGEGRNRRWKGSIRNKRRSSLKGW